MIERGVKEIGYTIVPYFLHLRRALSLLDSGARALLRVTPESSNINDLRNSGIIDGLLDIIRFTPILPLEEMVLRNKVEVGSLFTLHRFVYFKGTSKAQMDEESGKGKQYAKFHGKLSKLPELRIFGRFSPEHFTCASATGMLSKHGTRFMLASVRSHRSGTLIADPIVIGDRLQKAGNLPMRYSSEVRPEEIDEFSKIGPHGMQSADVKPLKDISEWEIKRHFAEILAEKHILNDWGGETSDLFTTRVHVAGKRVNAAFLFKGPAAFHPMTMRDLGKNGDQLVRLFSEPADLYIVQHCHHITAAIRHHLDAFASRPHQPSRYCVIDGVDTLRVLRAYGYIAQRSRGRPRKKR